jgi:VWFA-related protein
VRVERNKGGAAGVYTVTAFQRGGTSPMTSKGLQLFRVAAAASVLLAGAGVSALAQDAPYPPTENTFPAPPPQNAYVPPTIKVNAQLVVLDVVVTDRKGNLVQRALTRDDFTVFENGVEQKIRNFEGPEAHRMPRSGTAIVNSAADLKKIGNAPVTILVIDELNTKFMDSSFSRQMLVKYLQTQPAVLPEPTALMVAKNTTFQQLHDYTQNRDELIETIKKHMPENPWRLNNSGPVGPGAVERMAQGLAALEQIAQASTGTPGRKNLIWVGVGFPAANLVGLDSKEADLLEAAMRRVTARLLAARVTMYSINPIAGSSATIDVESTDDLNGDLDANGGDPFGQGKVSFSSFAPSTGGIAFTGRNDLNNVIGEGIAKGQEYYSMSYVPTDHTQDATKFRNIKIVMKDKSLRATTRDGYFPLSEADLNPVLDKTMTASQIRSNLQLDLSGALTTTISYNGLAVTAVHMSGDTYAIRVAEDGIGWSDPGTDGAQHEEATVAAGWYDAKGKLLGHVAREEVSPRGGPNAGASFTLPIAPPQGVVRLRIVVRDALNGHMGTVDVSKF